MARKTLAALTLLTTLAAPLSVEARLMDASSPLPEERQTLAVHLPTGCMAQLTFEDDWLRAAAIIDRHCLPEGVEATPVPGSLHDFSVMDTF